MLCHESIYRFVYRQQARVKVPVVPLPPPGDQTGLAGTGAQQLRPLHRPPHPYPPGAAGGGGDAGDLWPLGGGPDGFGRSGAVVLALHERTSRLLVAVRQGSKRAGLLEPCPCPRPGARPSPSTGTEFARHFHALGIQTFFCDTHSPWQKGGVENAICPAPPTSPRSVYGGPAAAAPEVPRLPRSSTTRCCTSNGIHLPAFAGTTVHLAQPRDVLPQTLDVGAAADCC